MSSASLQKTPTALLLTGVPMALGDAWLYRIPSSGPENYRQIVAAPALMRS